MNLNESKYNLREMLLDSTNLLCEMSWMSSKNTHLYQDYHQIFHLRRLNFFQNMYFVYLCKQKFDILKKPSQFRFSFEIVLYYVKLINFFPINFLVDFVSRFPNIYQLLLKHPRSGKKRTYYKITVR